MSDTFLEQVGLDPTKTYYVDFWNVANLYYYTVGPTFEAFNASHWTSYAVLAATPNAAGRWVGDFSTVSTVPVGQYAAELRLRAGGSPADTDTVVAGYSFWWDGTQLIPNFNVANGAGAALATATALGTVQSGVTATNTTLASNLSVATSTLATTAALNAKIGTNLTYTGGLPNVNIQTGQLTVAQIATGVWQDATAGDFTAANSIGKSLFTGVAPGNQFGGFVTNNSPFLPSAIVTSGSVNFSAGIAANITGNLSGSVGSVATAVSANLVQILGVAVTGTAAWVAAAFSKFFNVNNSAATTASVDQTADVGVQVSTPLVYNGGLPDVNAVVDTPFGFSGTATAGGASTVTFDSSASGSDGIYNGQLVTINIGTANQQVRKIVSYISRVATVDFPWNAPAPTAGTPYNLPGINPYSVVNIGPVTTNEINVSQNP